MDTTASLTSWGITGALAAGGLYYYYYRPLQQNRPARNREDGQHGGRKKRNEQEPRGRQDRRPTPESANLADEIRRSGAEASRTHHKEAPKKRKAQAREPAKAQQVPTVAVQSDEQDEPDVNTKQWAEQMVQAQKGHDIGTTKSKDQRVKTVKQSSALNTPELSSGSSQADEDLPSAQSPSLNAGDVSDMLGPVTSGPSTLRVTAPTKPQQEKAKRQPKEEVVESKKQRQNRKKVEERRLQREAEEKERKALEERQRRAAREARGEPAKNGIPLSKPPTNNAWKDTAPTSAETGSDVTVTNGSQNAPLLDTFDAESTSSSNGGLEASTAATSTTEGQADRDMPSEEDQVATAMKQSEDDSGWVTAQPKKQKKKNVASEPSASEPGLSNKTNVPTTRPTVNGKPKGLQALDVQYEQDPSKDPNDASNWDA